MGSYWAYANLMRIVLPEPRLSELHDAHVTGMPRFFREHGTEMTG